MRKEYKNLFDSLSRKLRNLSKTPSKRPSDCEYIFIVRDENKNVTNYGQNFYFFEDETRYDHLAQMIEELIFQNLLDSIKLNSKRGTYPDESKLETFYNDILDDVMYFFNRRFRKVENNGKFIDINEYLNEELRKADGE